MEFNEKLQELRRQKGITQEELAESLFVSRTAISKWESGRGYPSIDSLKAIAEFFGITIDELLSGKELLDIAEEDSKQKSNNFCDLIFGLLDVSTAMLLFLPFFRQKANGIVQGISLFALTEISPYLKTTYYVFVFLIIIEGILTFALQNCTQRLWVQNKSKMSLFVNFAGVILFVISMQPYGTTFLLAILAIKILTLTKKK
ncbi:MAG: helix-turn-helix transcriptional regulator [Acutalibacteraceae bacterium]|nr:helix-turn-helix transcriptional regulator [Acutalibacteraceae bacterium]